MYNAKQFLEALTEIEATKGIARDDILEALKEAFEKGLKKQLGGDDALVSVNINVDTGIIDMAQIKMVVEEVEDDFLQISLEDARQENPDYKIGDEYRIPANVENIVKSTALQIKSILKQKIAEKEKESLYNLYKDKIGEMITGVVDKVEERGIFVTIARTSVYVPRRDLIGDEKFQPKDTIRLYVSDVVSGPKGARIGVSRANEGFLNRVFEEEIHEVYDGTIVIKAIARKAGERSKVAVYSQDENVDPAGACIGPNGTRIQKVVARLGNGSTKEKVDVIGYNENPGLFIIEALKPAQVLGVNVDKENKTALAVVNNDTLSLAYGRKWVNVRLAEQLTGYKIEILELDDAYAQGKTYQTVEELERIEIEEKQAEAQRLAEEQARLAEEKARQERLLASIPEGYVAPQARVYDDEIIDDEEKEILEKQLEREQEQAVMEEAKANENAAEQEEKAEEVVLPKEEKVEEVKPVEKAPETPVAPTTKVKTTTTLEALEATLADEAKKAKSSTTKTRRKKKEEKVEEEVATTIVEPTQRMDIYTKEELEEIAKEDEQESYDDYDEDIDYDDYDDYYDDDEK